MSIHERSEFRLAIVLCPDIKNVKAHDTCLSHPNLTVLIAISSNSLEGLNLVDCSIFWTEGEKNIINDIQNCIVGTRPFVSARALGQVP